MDANKQLSIDQSSWPCLAICMALKIQEWHDRIIPMLGSSFSATAAIVPTSSNLSNLPAGPSSGSSDFACVGLPAGPSDASEPIWPVHARQVLSTVWDKIEQECTDLHVPVKCWRILSCSLPLSVDANRADDASNLLGTRSSGGLCAAIAGFG